MRCHHLHKEKDGKRDADLAEAGYKVFRFTGTRINRDAVGCIAKVIAEAGLTPDAEPVADIRTGMMGPENPNSAGGPQSGYLRAVRQTAARMYTGRAMRKFCNRSATDRGCRLTPSRATAARCLRTRDGTPV